MKSKFIFYFWLGGFEHVAKRLFSFISYPHPACSSDVNFLPFNESNKKVHFLSDLP